MQQRRRIQGVVGVVMAGWAFGGAWAAEPAKPAPLDAAKAHKEPQSDLLWFNATTLTLEGKGWADTETPYRRLPARAKEVVTESVWNLSFNTAGICVRFVTDSKQIGAIWDGGGAMNHMAATGNSGLDLYVRRADGWAYCGTGRPQPQRTVAVVAKGLSGKQAEYLLYLPLYHAVNELRIGVEAGAWIAPGPQRPEGMRRPIVFYGTSITQGGCAARAGMCHPALVGRWFDREVINLGFSGSGKMEPAMADLLGELDAAVYVLECLPNMTTEMVSERVAPFVRILRKHRPTTPIVLVESPLHPETNAGNAALREVYRGLVTEGVTGLHYQPGTQLLAGREEATVDGSHPTDLGFYRMATVLEPMLASVLVATGAAQ